MLLVEMKYWYFHCWSKMLLLISIQLRVNWILSNGMLLLISIQWRVNWILSNDVEIDFVTWDMGSIVLLYYAGQLLYIAHSYMHALHYSYYRLQYNVWCCASTTQTITMITFTSTLTQTVTVTKPNQTRIYIIHYTRIESILNTRLHTCMYWM